MNNELMRKILKKKYDSFLAPLILHDIEVINPSSLEEFNQEPSKVSFTFELDPLKDELSCDFIAKELIKELDIDNAKEIIFLPFQSTGSPAELNIDNEHERVKYRILFSKEVFSKTYSCRIDFKYIITKKRENK